MSISGLGRVRSTPESEGPRFTTTAQPASSMKYSNPALEEKSTKNFMVSEFLPDLKLAPSGAYGPLHQSQLALPGLIQLVSAIIEGGFRLRMVFDSIRRPGSEPIRMTRHGVTAGGPVMTEGGGSSGRGDR